MIRNCRLGKDIHFKDITNNWGFNAVLLATGAWNDRPLPVSGIDKYLGKGFYYQNPFVQWFNLSHDPSYGGPDFEIRDGAVVIGGGLASIDVAKILMIETFRQAINKLGKNMDSITVERLGLSAAAEQVAVNLDDLDLKGCTVFYRRRIIDMPLSPDPVNKNEADMKKAHTVREKIVSLAMDKYKFKLVDCHSPKEIITDNERITGIIMQKNKIENGRAVPVKGEITRITTPLIISSIGSIPDIIDGIKGSDEKFDLDDPQSGRLTGYHNVFALGNAVTGKGNIKESQLHGRNVSESIIRDYLGVDQTEHKSDYDFKNDFVQQLQPVAEFVQKSKPLPEEKFNEIMYKVKNLQQKAGYENDYNSWIKKNLPIRLENMSA